LLRTILRSGLQSASSTRCREFSMASKGPHASADFLSSLSDREIPFSRQPPAARRQNCLPSCHDPSGRPRGQILCVSLLVGFKVPAVSPGERFSVFVDAGKWVTVCGPSRILFASFAFNSRRMLCFFLICLLGLRVSRKISAHFRSRDYPDYRCADPQIRSLFCHSEPRSGEEICFFLSPAGSG